METAFGGLFVHKPLWTLSWQGWLLLLGILSLTFAIAVLNVHRFLSVQAPVDSRVLVVEGWLPDYALREAAAIFQRDNYDYLLTVGLPLAKGSLLVAYESHAQVSAETFVKLGIEPSKIFPIALTQRVQRQRTFAMANRVKEWLADNPLPLTITRFNLISLDVHSRRSRLLYRQVLGPEIQIGAIAIPCQDFDPTRWWRESAGFKLVIFECLAYFLVRFFLGRPQSPDAV
ncbi:MAG: YdcF family protein [Cyanobacteria bacterium P01_H01_bin.15]